MRISSDILAFTYLLASKILSRGLDAALPEVAGLRPFDLITSGHFCAPSQWYETYTILQCWNGTTEYAELALVSGPVAEIQGIA